MSNVQETIRKQVEDNPILLYMKGTRQFPECGFSMRTVQALDSYGIEYATVNVLENEGIRQGIKEFGNWPTIPQLYVNGELLGGCDIIMEMYQSGELKQHLQNAASKAG
ncbi:MAG: Grx4 family monothiol glutaredoxin [Nitrococcus sp.]|nr:Grx4 family monothiol glutaredoxin [Nitrococcus sp.]